MYSPLDIVGLVLGILGLSGTVMFVRYLLPKHRLAASERVYATAYSLYRCSVSEGLLLPSEKTMLLEKLQSIRKDLNNLKNGVMCLNGTWCQMIVALIDIYRGLSAIDHTLQSICTQIASTSRKGRERLEKNGIPYEPCMFPLAATVSNCLESFGTSSEPDVPPLFPSQEHPRCSIPLDAESAPLDDCNEQQPSASSRTIRPPQHRDSFSSTATTVVGNQCSCDVHLDTSAGATQEELNPLRFLPGALEKGVDPSSAVNSYCTDLQWRVNVLQAALSPLQSSESSATQNSDYTADLEKCKEDLLAVMGRLSKVSDIWFRRETGPVLPI